MDRIATTLQLVLIVAVVGLGVVVWRADVHARDAAARQECLARADATATITLMAPGSAVDEEGRIEAMRTLSSQVDAC